MASHVSFVQPSGSSTPSTSLDHDISAAMQSNNHSAASGNPGHPQLSAQSRWTWGIPPEGTQSNASQAVSTPETIRAGRPRSFLGRIYLHLRRARLSTPATTSSTLQQHAAPQYTSPTHATSQYTSPAHAHATFQYTSPTQNTHPIPLDSTTTSTNRSPPPATNNHYTSQRLASSYTTDITASHSAQLDSTVQNSDSLENRNPRRRTFDEFRADDASITVTDRPAQIPRADTQLDHIPLPLPQSVRSFVGHLKRWYDEFATFFTYANEVGHDYTQAMPGSFPDEVSYVTALDRERTVDTQIPTTTTTTTTPSRSSYTPTITMVPVTEPITLEEIARAPYLEHISGDESNERIKKRMDLFEQFVSGITEDPEYWEAVLGDTQPTQINTEKAVRALSWIEHCREQRKDDELVKTHQEVFGQDFIRYLRGKLLHIQNRVEPITGKRKRAFADLDIELTDEGRRKRQRNLALWENSPAMLDIIGSMASQAERRAREKSPSIVPETGRSGTMEVTELQAKEQETTERVLGLRPQLHEELRERVQELLKEEEELQGPPSPPKSIIQPLSSELDQKVTDALAIPEKGHELGTNFTRRDLDTLLPSGQEPGWLNDEIVAGYLGAVVKARLQENGYNKDAGDVPKIHAFSTHMYSTYKAKGKDVTQLVRWANRAKIGGAKLLDVDTVLIPINNGFHWTLLAISGTNRTVTFYDSIDGPSEKYVEFAFKWLSAVLGNSYRADDWTVVPGQSVRQTNGDDCGVFVCLNALALARGQAPASSFEEVGLPLARRQIAGTLLNGGFGGEIKW